MPISKILSDSFASGVGGKVLQVVHKDADTNGTKVQNTSGTFATAFSASITPTLSTSKILVVINFSYMSNRSGDQLYTGHKLIRDIGGTTTTISSGKSASDDTSFMTSHLRYINHPASAQLLGNGVFNILDTPNTTSAISYLLQHAQLGSNNWTQTGGAYFTLTEISG